jgi:arylformamidase
LYATPQRGRNPARPTAAKEARMPWIDATLPLSADVPAWPGDDPFLYRETSTIRAGAESNGASMSLGLHFGTHIDAPYHFLEGGATVDALDLELLVGPCVVAALPHVLTRIEARDLALAVPARTRRLLVKTRNSEFLREPEFRTDYAHFSADAVAWLVARGVRLLGIDYFSIAAYADARPAHAALLGAGGVALEGVDLAAVAPGPYELLCLPLKLKGAGGAPTRVLLRPRV